MFFNKRPKATAILFTSIMLFSACKDEKKQPETAAAPAPAVDVIIAQTKNISNIIEANGTIVANEFVELRCEASGRLGFLDVPEGNFVKQGTIIARVNDADLQAPLRRVKSQLELAQKTEERLKKLLAVNGLNQADYDAAITEVTTQQSEVNRLTALINKTVVKAPFDGVAGLRKLSIGAYITSADIITTIQQVSKLKVDFTLPETYGNLIKKGSTVEIQVNANTQRYKAVVIATEPQINTTTRNITVRAILQGGSVNPGSFVKVYVQGATNKNSIMVPGNAIIPDAKNKKVVLVKNGKALFTDVETGVRETGTVEITKGIAAGDTVVVTGVLFARPDKPVKIRTVKSLKEFAE